MRGTLSGASALAPSRASPRQAAAAEPPARLERDNVALLSHVRSGPGRLAATRFALEQRLFGLGFGAAGAARAWYRRYEWTDTHRRLGTSGALRALLKRPGRVVREAWHAAARHGAAVREVHGVPTWKQRLDLVWLGLRHGLDPESYYRFWLFRPERRRKAGKYIQQHEAGLLYRVLAVRESLDDFYVTEDKRLFERWCREQSLPAATSLAQFTGGVAIPAAPVIRLPERDLFSKPVDSFGGTGARRWRYAGGGRWRGVDESLCDREDLFAALAEQSRAGAILLQEALDNDGRVAHLSSGALCTARIITIRPPGGRPEVACAVYRMATRGHSTDNFSIAGLAAGIELLTGRLGAAVRSDPELVIAPVKKHPDTGAVIEGTLLPWWRDARALALDAHARLRAIACVGWDIALTGAGPVLVEANWAPGARLAQAPSGIPLGETNFLRYLDAHLRRSFSRRRQD